MTIDSLLGKITRIDSSNFTEERMKNTLFSSRKLLIKRRFDVIYSELFYADPNFGIEKLSAVRRQRDIKLGIINKRS